MSDQPEAPNSATFPTSTTASDEPSRPWFKRWWGITLIVVGLLVVIAAFTGDPDNSEQTPEADDPAPAAAAEEAPEEEPADEEPTADESAPAPEPAPEAAEEEPVPEPEPEPAPTFELVDGPVTADGTDRDWTWEQVLDGQLEGVPGELEVHTGAGDDIVDFQGTWPTAVIDAYHTGSSNFIVRSATTAGQGRSVVNDIGSYQGRMLVSENDDLVGLDVTADGQWAFVVRRLDQATTQLAQTYQGQGDAVILFPFDPSDPAPTDMFGRLSATHTGSSNFIVREALARSLINEIGSYEGTVRLPADGLFGLTIAADGPWELQLE